MRGAIGDAIGTVALFAAAICFGLVPPKSGRAAEPHYDLGGPCTNSMGPGPFSQIVAAKKGGDWNRAVELEKLSVREGCQIQYRWNELVISLLHADRPGEALQVLEEMDSRGFELNPSTISSQQEELRNFFETPQFKRSPVGIKVERLKRISDERRSRYRTVLQKIPAEQRPPDRYVANGACPFECCQYRRWTVMEDTDLVATPGSQRVVGRARRRNRVMGLTGEVHLKPEPVLVVGGGDLPEGSIAFVLDYIGEGYAHVYSRGKVIESFLGVADYCFRPSESCWGERLFPSEEGQRAVWWVKVRLANGATGWTDKPERFGDKDACG